MEIINIERRGLVQKFRHHSTVAQCQRRGRVAFTSVSGPLGVDSFQALRLRIAEAGNGSACMVLRVDHAVNMMQTIPWMPSDIRKLGAIPGAVIVRPDQYAMWAAYAKSMSSVGVKRLVFLDSQRDLCREWVDVMLSV